MRKRTHPENLLVLLLAVVLDLPQGLLLVSDDGLAALTEAAHPLHARVVRSRQLQDVAPGGRAVGVAPLAGPDEIGENARASSHDAAVLLPHP